MKMHPLKRSISVMLAFCQISIWSQTSFAGAEKAAVSAAQVATEALSQNAGRAAAAGGSSEAAQNMLLGLNKVPVPPSQFAKTPMAQAVGDAYIGSPASFPPGHPLFGKGISIPLASKGRVIGEIGMMSNPNVNAVSILRKLKLGEITMGAVKQFPMEAFTFFVALGALSKGQLMMSFADNPASFEQHLNAHDFRTAEGRMGYMGFLAFMQGSRHTENVLRTIWGANGRLGPFIPYIGMSIGFLMSNVIHEAGNIEEVKKCVASLESRVADEEKYSTCERAYDSWAEYRYEKMKQFAPTIFAMLTSTLAAGVLSSKVGKVVMAVGWKVGFTAARVAAGGNPLGIVVTFGGWVLKVGQFMLFTKAQEMIEPSLTQWFKNTVNGGDLKSLETDLMTQLHFKKKTKWKLPLQKEYGDLDLSLRKLSQLSFDWRKGNIMDIIMAHQAWQTYLSSYSQSYTATMNFYSNYIGEYQNRYILNKPSLLDAQYLLSGVYPTLPESTENQPNELVRKKEYEYYQVQRLVEARKAVEEEIKKFTKEEIAQDPKFFAEFNKALGLLPTEDVLKQTTFDLQKYANALDMINKALLIEPHYPGSNADQDQAPIDPNDIPEDVSPEAAETIEITGTHNYKSGFFRDGREYYSALRKAIGDPVPLRDPGIGYLRAYEFSPTGKDSLAGLNFPITEETLDIKNGNKNYINRLLKWAEFISQESNFLKSKTNTINYFQPTQFMIAQSVLGPRADLGQPLTEATDDGFPAFFKPPRLTESYKYEFQLDQIRGRRGTLATIFNTPVKVIGSSVVTYNSLFQVARSQNIMPSVVNHKDGFMGWWKEHVESQYIEAWQKFEESYQHIMVRLMDRYKYYNKGITAQTMGQWWDNAFRSGMSNSPLSNGLQISYRQERRLYQMILGEIVKDHYDLVSKDTAFVRLGRPNPEIAKGSLDIKGYSTDAITNQSRIHCSGIASNYDECEKKKRASEPFNQIPYIPILEVMKSIEPYSLSAIIASYGKDTLVPYPDAFAKNHFGFQDDIEYSFYALERLMDEMKLTPVQAAPINIRKAGGNLSFLSENRVVVSTITNKHLADAQKKIA